MDRNAMRQALMVRGIRVPEDDPLFVLLELNEIHFDAIAAKHFQVINQHIVVEVVSQVMARHGQRQPQQPRCTNDAAMGRAAQHLDEVAAKFAKFEDRMAEVARAAASATARTVADTRLRDLGRELSAAVARFEKYSEQGAAITKHAGEMSAAARNVQSLSASWGRWWVATLVIAVVALMIGMAAGHGITTAAFEKVRAACAPTHTQ